jgi:hypothetical protein
VEEALARARAEAEVEAAAEVADASQTAGNRNAAERTSRHLIPEGTTLKTVQATPRTTPPPRRAEPSAMPVRKKESD